MEDLHASLTKVALLCMVSILAMPAGALTQVEANKLLAGDGTAYDVLGYSVSIDGDTAVIGALGDDGARGAAYVFNRTGTTWTQQAKLTASDRALFDEFGRSASVDGDTVVIGSWLHDGLGSNSGAAYVFTRTGATWTQQAKLTANDAESDARFGYRVSIAGDSVLVGAIFDDNYVGSAYVFVRSGTTWTEQAKLTASDRAQYHSFGGGVAIDGDTAVIAAYQDDDRGGDSGSAYVFTRSGTTWTEQAKLTASDGAAGDFFGTWVSIDGETALIGAFFNDERGTDAGAAYVFTRMGANWTEQAKLTASDGVGGDLFGNSVALDGDMAVIGAYGHDFVGADSGAAYVFSRVGTTWSEQAKLLASDSAAGDVLGLSVSISGGTVAITAPLDDDSGTNSGAAYVYDVISNAAPTVTIAAPTQGSLLPVSTEVQLIADIVDPDVDDTHACTVNWGDDTGQGPVVCYATVSGFTAGPHAYLAAGVYTVFITVTDASGDTADAEIMVVVYDPSAGFVTGGGWISSPAGAYVPDPGLSGKASYGFVSRYRSGATTPDGNTQFVFQAGDFNFHSSSYQWLVVAGGKAQFKGTGAVNGQSGHGFLIFATDAELTSTIADVDAFRIKIWDSNNGDAVVYDNGTEQALGGGRIVIHTGDNR